MIGIEAGAHHGHTHSGTQPYVRYENGKAVYQAHEHHDKADEHHR